FTSDDTSWLNAEVNYLTQMADKYDSVILSGMFGVSESSTTADNLSTALRASRRQFFRYVRDNGHINNSFVMNMFDSEVTVQGTGRYSAKMDVQFADTSGETSTDRGQIVISAEPEDG